VHVGANVERAGRELDADQPRIHRDGRDEQVERLEVEDGDRQLGFDRAGLPGVSVSDTEDEIGTEHARRAHQHAEIVRALAVVDPDPDEATLRGELMGSAAVISVLYRLDGSSTCTRRGAI
jgi:hypothetical protein